MIRTNKFLGSILLISGTSIGAGMLGIPVMSCFSGFFPSFILLAVIWFFMFLTSLLFLEVNIATPGEPNLVSMASKTLGFWGKAISWTAYLLLLYCLVSAYIAASSPLFLTVLDSIFNMHFPSWIGPFPLLAIFGVFVYIGTRAVDYINRILMFGLVIAYILLVIFVPSHIHFDLLSHVDVKPMLLAVPMIIVSYGFHIIIPTLTTYMNHDKKKLRWALFIGSLIPFFIYLLWEFLVLGAVPLLGDNGLVKSFTMGELSTAPLMRIIKNPLIYYASSLFAFFAVVTSFIGVSLSLSDFLTDGLKLGKKSGGKEIVTLLTFIPPLIFVYAYPRGFYLALQYAAVFVAILLCILPALMTWALPKPCVYRSFWGRVFLIFIIVVSLGIITLDILEEAHILKQLMSHYLN